MRIIEKLNDFINAELDDAEKYIKCALENKDIDQPLAQMFYSLANDEMRHMDILHDAVTEKIRDYKKEHGEPPADMQAVYDYLHKIELENAQYVKNMLTDYKK